MIVIVAGMIVSVSMIGGIIVVVTPTISMIVQILTMIVMIATVIMIVLPVHMIVMSTSIDHHDRWHDRFAKSMDYSSNVRRPRCQHDSDDRFDNPMIVLMIVLIPG